MYIGLPSLALRSSSAGFSPASLFAAGEQGGWYDPSDISTMAQDSVGITPAAIEQPVGLIMDKRTGLVRTAATVPNADFSSGTSNWNTAGSATFTVSAGQATITAAVGGGSGITSAAPITGLGVSGQLVYVTFQVISITGSLRAMLNGGSVNSFSSPVSAPGTYTLPILTSAAAVPNGQLSFWLVNLNDTCVIDNISVATVTGNHLIQATAASRPTLSARYNKLTKTEQFDDAAWTKRSTDTVTANAANSPLGTLTADKHIPGVAGIGDHFVQQNASMGLGSIVCSIYMKAAEFGFGYLKNQTDGGGTYKGVIVDLSSGSILSNPGTGTGSAVVTTAGSGWWKVTLTTTQTAGSVAFTVSALLNSTPTFSAFGDPQFSGDGVSGIYIWGADCRTGADAALAIPAYQRVDTATSYDTSGFPMYLNFDGVDDNLSAANMNLSGTQKVTVFFGAGNLSANTTVPYELTTITNSSAGGFDGVFQASGAFDASQNPTGTNLTGASSSAVAPPQSSVYSAQHDMTTLVASAAIVERRNGAAYSTGGTNVSAANFASAPFFLGARSGPSNPLLGRVYQMIIRGAASTAAQIISGERFTGSKMGINL